MISRRQLVERVRRELEQRSYPRLQMLLLVALTGGAGFLASVALLHSGWETLSWRYGLSVVIAYVVFLLLLWLWLRTDAADYDDRDGTWMNVTDALSPQADSEPLVELPELPDLPDVADGDEFAIPLGVLLFVITVVVTVLAASVSVVYSAPVLFAELLVDGVLAATLYRRLRHLEPRHWLQSAVRRTIVPFAITALLMMAAGWGLSTHAPTARTLGEVLASH